MKDFICTLNGPCFGHDRDVVCSVLTSPPSGYKNGVCPFQKKDREVTDGVRYPYSLGKCGQRMDED